MNFKKYTILGLCTTLILSASIGCSSKNSPDNNNNNNNKITNETNLITSEKAKDIMLDKVPGAKIVEFSFDDNDNENPEYDGTLTKDNSEYEIDVDAKTGKIISFEEKKSEIINNNQNTNNSSGEYIGEEKAKSIMLEKVPGATIVSFSFDNDDNTPEYEGELRKDNIEYDISVDAKTGEIITFEKDHNND